MQSDRFIDMFYRPFSHEKLPLCLSCKNFNAATDRNRPIRYDLLYETYLY